MQRKKESNQRKGVGMEMWVILGALGVGVLVLRWILKNVNVWVYVSKHHHHRLPPGDLGWPFLGNMLSFLSAFKSTNPDSFVDSLHSRYGNTGIYKSLMFGNPSVIVTTTDGCRRVLADDEKFMTGWPRATIELIGKNSFIIMPYEEHKRLRRLTAASVNGLEALSLYLTYIEEDVISSLEKWTCMGEIEFLTQVRKLTFRAITHIFLGAANNSVVEALEKEYTTLNHGIRAMAINIPGFAFHKALKARKKLVSVFQSVVDARRKEEKEKGFRKTKDMMDALMKVEDENGRKLSDEEIIDIMLMYLNAGHESSGHITMWATIFLQNHPKYFQMAKAEHEEIIKKRPPTQTRLTMKEIRQMDFTSKVVDETMRLITFAPMVFREAKCDVNLYGYTIPRGWKVLTWFRTVHYNPEIYPSPKEFNPLRWDNFTPKPGELLPFRAGSRLCPGKELAKMEITVFLHHFLLNYKLEQRNPKCHVRHLPHTRPVDNCLARVKKCST